MLINTTYIVNWRKIRQRQRNNALINNARENRSRIPHDYQPNQQIYDTNRDIKKKLRTDKERQSIISMIHTNGTLTIQCTPTMLERINIRRALPVG